MNTKQRQRQRLVAIELNQGKKLDFIAETIGTSELPYRKKNKNKSFWFASWRNKISFEDVQFRNTPPTVDIEMQLYDDSTIVLTVKSEDLSQYKELDLMKEFHLTRENLYYNDKKITDRYEREKRANHVRIAYSYINEVVWEKIVDMLNKVPNFWNYEVIQEVQASAQMLHF